MECSCQERNTLAQWIEGASPGGRPAFLGCLQKWQDETSVRYQSFAVHDKINLGSLESIVASPFDATLQNTPSRAQLE